ncbi:flagellar protein FlaG [Propionivibrio sp.]|uniref:flagellar protein FlaG n=1 Tax=Propionivibrio sp. TaxID=2212460 RepID=UPI0026037266|nr:flagellar protein FlaG [Propionivibrio sp.]
MSIQTIISTSSPLQSSHEASSVVREARAAAPSAPEKAAPPAKPVQAASTEQLQAAVKSVEEYIQPTNDALEFSLSDETGGIVVKIIDRDTKEVIRQIPSEEMIAIAKALDSIKGLFVKQNA